MLIPERAIDAHLNVAAARGAEMRFGVALKNWRAMPDGFEFFSRTTRSFPRAFWFSPRPMVLRSRSEGSAFRCGCSAMSRPGSHRAPRSTTPAGFPPFSSIAKVCPHRSMAFRISATGSKLPSMALAISPTRNTAIAGSTSGVTSSRSRFTRGVDARGCRAFA